MAAPTIPEVLLGFEGVLEPVIRVTPYVADQINPPAAVVGCPPVEYHKTFQRGRMQLDGEIYVFVSKAVDRIGQMALAEFANPTGAKSIISAVYADKTLGGVVEDTIIRTFRPLGMEEVGVIGYHGGVFEWSVVAKGS